MARPFIEFVHEQVLPWKEGVSGRPGVYSRVLSEDDDLGGSSQLLRYPPGWTVTEPSVTDADEELFVLVGSLTIGSVSYKPFTYAFLPAGFPRLSMSARAGATVLTFFSRETRDICNPSSTETAFDESRLVERVDALEGSWGSGFHPLFPPGAGRKYLREDPLTHDQTWILATMALRWGRRAEAHPVVEEMFLLSGELVGPLGKMYPGSYFWRPPEKWHGPFGSLTGNLMLFRTIGGPLSTVYAEQEVDFCWNPAHKPILPPELEAYSEPVELRPGW